MKTTIAYRGSTGIMEEKTETSIRVQGLGCRVHLAPLKLLTDVCHRPRHWSLIPRSRLQLREQPGPKQGFACLCT